MAQAAEGLCRFPLGLSSLVGRDQEVGELTGFVLGGGGELTPRERELVALVAQGRTNAEIARQLFISVRTVSSHLDRIRAKTGARRRADLTRLALQESLV